MKIIQHHKILDSHVTLRHVTLYYIIFIMPRVYTYQQLLASIQLHLPRQAMETPEALFYGCALMDTNLVII